MIALVGGKSSCRSICGEAVLSNIMTEDGVPQSRGGLAALLAGGGNEERYLDIVSSSTPPRLNVVWDREPHGSHKKLEWILSRSKGVCEKIENGPRNF